MQVSSGELLWDWTQADHLILFLLWDFQKCLILLWCYASWLTLELKGSNQIKMISVWERKAFILVTLVQNKIHQRATTKAERPVMLGLNFCPHLSVISTVTNTWRCCPSSSYRKCVCWFMSMVKFEPQPCFSECRPSPWSKVNHYNINFLIHLHGIYWDLIQTYVTYQALCHLQYTWVSRRSTESKYSPNRGNKDRSRLRVWVKYLHKHC